MYYSIIQLIFFDYLNYLLTFCIIDRLKAAQPSVPGVMRDFSIFFLISYMGLNHLCCGG